MSKDLELQDSSNDRKYFTIVPNYILNHSTAIDQALYMQMKKFAGDSGKCFTSERELMRLLGIGRKALHVSLEYLLTHHWIEAAGTKTVSTKGGPQEVKVYEMTDIWRKNADYYEGGSKRTDLDAKVVPEGTQGGSRRTPNKIIQEDNTNTASLVDAEPPSKSKTENWKLAEEYIITNTEKWKGSGYGYPTKEGIYDWRYLLNHGKTTPDKLIGALYWESKQRNTDDTREFNSSEKAWESFRQEQKTAVKLANLFTPDEFRAKLEEVAEWASGFKDAFDWKLSTILKRLND